MNLIGKSKTPNNAPVENQVVEESDPEFEQEGQLPSSSVQGLASSVYSLASGSETPSSFGKKIKKSKYLDSGVKQLFPCT